LADEAGAEALLVGLVSQEAMLMHQEGVEAYHSGDLTRSQALFSSATILMPNNPSSLEGLGAASFGLGDYSTAADSFLAAMARGSGDGGESLRNARTARDFELVERVLLGKGGDSGDTKADQRAVAEGAVAEGVAVVSTFFRGEGRYSPSRFAEIVAAQAANLLNPEVAALVLLADLAHDCDPRAFLDDPSAKLSVVQQEGSRAPTWGELMRVGEARFPGRAVVFAHADIAFFAQNASLGLVPRLLYAAQREAAADARPWALALTRRPHSACLWASGGGHGLFDVPVDLCTGPHGNAEGVIGFDAYALVMPAPPSLLFAASLLLCNRLGADLKMVEAMGAADMVVVDPCVAISATHVHCTAERTYAFDDDLVTREDIVSGRYSRAVRLSGPSFMGEESLVHAGGGAYSSDLQPEALPSILLSFPSSGENWARAALEAEPGARSTGSVAFDAELWSMGLKGEGRCSSSEGIGWVAVPSDRLAIVPDGGAASPTAAAAPLDGVRRAMRSAPCASLLRTLASQAPLYRDATVILMRCPFDTVASLWLYRVLSHRRAHLQRRRPEDGDPASNSSAGDSNSEHDSRAGRGALFLDTATASSAAHLDSSDPGWRAFAVDAAHRWARFYGPLVGDPRVVRLDHFLASHVDGKPGMPPGCSAAAVGGSARVKENERPAAAAWGLVSGFSATPAFGAGLAKEVFRLVSPVACAVGFVPPPGFACAAFSPLPPLLPLPSLKRTANGGGDVIASSDISLRDECLPRSVSLKPSRCVVAFSLYGSDERYTGGALANARALLLNRSNRGGSLNSGSPLSPLNDGGAEWRMRVYHDESPPPSVLQALSSLGVECVLVPPEDRGPSGGQLANPRTWRFLVASDPTVARYLIRDVDSRISRREAAAVRTWCSHTPSVPFHVMRDHPSHTTYARAGYPMQAGMWGGTHAAVPEMTRLLRAAGNRDDYVADQAFLRDQIWPLAVVRGVLQHDSFGCTDAASATSLATHPFPWSASGRISVDTDDFVGAVVLGDGCTRASDNAARATAQQPEECKDRLP
jgi:hypothetical protein